MAITSIFLRKPVLSISLNILILCLGIFCSFKLPISQYPLVSNAVIDIRTTYPGASPHLVAGLVTAPIETAIANAEGVDYISSKSIANQSIITVHLKLNANSQTLLLDILNKLGQISNQLPEGSLKPIVEKKSDTATPLMYISLQSPTFSAQKMTDYAIRVIQPQLNNLEGVAKIDILGGRKYALRLILDPLKLASHQLSPRDITHALIQNQYMTTVGQTQNEWLITPLSANTDLHKLGDFKRLIVPCHDGSNIHLEDIAKVVFGSENSDDEASFDGQKSIFLAVTPTPTANPLTVIKHVREQLPILESQYPKQLSSQIVYDATQYIKAALYEVILTLIEAIAIVIAVIYLFLGSWRAVIIPMITIPFSLLGMTTFLFATNCSINLLTLLAFVLAIGLVVDDAIVVLENIHRHFAKHGQIWKACFDGSAEISKAVIGMTITLAAVFSPIAFSQGLTGSLFKEFALTLAGTVLLSGVIALTLSPLMNTLILKPNHTATNKFTTWFQTVLARTEHFYFKKITQAIKSQSTALLVIGFAILLMPFLYQYAAHEIAPEEDQGFFLVVSNGQTQANKNANRGPTHEIESIFKTIPEMAHYFILNSATPFAGLVLKPWEKREISASKLKSSLQEQLNQITGLNSFAIIPPALPGGGDGAPFQMVLQSFGPIKDLVFQAETLLKKAKASGLFIFVNNSLKMNEIHYQLSIDREKAAAMNLNMQDIGQMLSGALANGQINYFALNDKRYTIIPRLAEADRLYPQQLLELQLINHQQQIIPLATIATLSPKIEPNMISHFQQANSTVIEGVPLPGISIGQVMQTMLPLAKKTLPRQIHVDFAGVSRQYLQEKSSLGSIFLLALLLIYLVLAVQYNSFRDPLVILSSLPLTFCAALLPVFFGLTSINIYTQIGLLTLIGLISKHGILIVDFANQLQKSQGYTPTEAVVEAAKLRLRPILMTTAAMLFGVIPLIFADGAGAKSRFSIGLVICSGISLGTFFTLFITPCLYSLLSSKKQVIQTESTIASTH